LTPRFVSRFGIIQGMTLMPDHLPDDLQLLKQMLAKMQSRVGFREEENALLRQHLFGRKSEQTVDPATPQLALFNEAECIAESVASDAEEEVVAPAKRRGKRKPLSAGLPRIEVIHELPEHEPICICGCRKHAIGEEVSEQLEIVSMQIRMIKHVRKVCGCRDCERHRSPPTSRLSSLKKAWPASAFWRCC
jgi:transposase